MTTLDDTGTDTRRAIRSAALRLAEQDGYAATTIERISAAAEVDPSTVRSTFATKADIFLHTPMTADLDGLFDAIAARPDEPAGAAVVVATRAWTTTREADTNADDARLYRLIAATPELTDALWQRATVWTDSLHRRLGPGLATRVRARTIISTCLDDHIQLSARTVAPTDAELLSSLEEAFSGLG